MNQNWPGRDLWMMSSIFTKQLHRSISNSEVLFVLGDRQRSQLVANFLFNEIRTQKYALSNQNKKDVQGPGNLINKKEEKEKWRATNGHLKHLIMI